MQIESLHHLADAISWDRAIEEAFRRSPMSIDPALAKTIAKQLKSGEAVLNVTDKFDAPLSLAVKWAALELKFDIASDPDVLIETLVNSGGPFLSSYYHSRAQWLFQKNEPSKAYFDLQQSVHYALDAQQLDRGFNLLKKLEKLSSVPFTRAVKVALMSDKTTNFLSRALKMSALRFGLKLDIYTPPYASVSQEILNPDSELYRFKPDAVILFQSWRDLNLPDMIAEPASVIRQEIDRQTQRWKALRENFSGLLIASDFDLPVSSSLGNLSGVDPRGLLSVLRQVNLGLRENASGLKVVIHDHERSSSLVGLLQYNDGAYWHGSQQHPAPNTLIHIARDITSLMAGSIGLAKKVLVLDLDNTLWGGVIGEDGLNGIKLGAPTAAGAAYKEFQSYILGLKRRGIVLAVCSKNNLEDAQLPFKSHDEMPIKLSDIAVFKANWSDKPSNLRDIAKALNLGIDSLVFVDDNPAERALVRKELPMVCVPEIPMDPTGYISALERGRYFESAGLSSEDLERADGYAKNIQREELKSQSANLEDFLKNLDMKAVCKPFDSNDLARVTQLIGKTNQFNLTGYRYSEDDVKRFSEDESFWTQSFRISDAYGEHGLVGVLIARPHVENKKALFIDTWLMSCRVIGRQVEQLMLDRLVEYASSKGFESLVGLYRKTSKNAMVSELFIKCGFSALDVKNANESDSYYSLKLGAYAPQCSAIRVVSSHGDAAL